MLCLVITKTYQVSSFIQLYLNLSNKKLIQNTISALQQCNHNCDVNYNYLNKLHISTYTNLSQIQLSLSKPIFKKRVVFRLQQKLTILRYKYQKFLTAFLKYLFQVQFNASIVLCKNDDTVGCSFQVDDHATLGVLIFIFLCWQKRILNPKFCQFSDNTCKKWLVLSLWDILQAIPLYFTSTIFIVQLQSFKFF
eukprot:TRINITY_DN10861_c0_g2_i3.p1 TRINITY_DN10861_c0_g2~~TRINITY_DN10861_c0_g2_i3.p1  ORF type:complete len:194 (+),score=-13.72 TRINITY_DN10861_c0_g2_i3:843-1424(+)